MISIYIDDPRERRLRIVVLIGAALVRIGLMVPGLGRLDDPDGYLDLARSLAEGRGFSIDGRATAYRPPLYPVLLAPLVGGLGSAALPWGLGALHLALGLGTVVLVQATARAWGLSPGRAWIAAGVAAFDPVLVGQGRVVMTETLAAFLVAATLAGLAQGGRRGAALGGLGFGLATLCRPSLLPAALLTATFALATRPGGGRQRVGRSLILAMATLVVLLPWMFRNWKTFGEPIATTTHGGYTLALANNPAYYADVLDGPPGAVWGGRNQKAWMSEVERRTQGMSEPEADRFFRWEALQIVKERPRDFLRASVARFFRFWGVAPSGSIYPRWLRLASTVWTVPLWVALAIGVGRQTAWDWPKAPAIAIILALTLVHLVYWTDMRMRAPLVPAIGLIAAGAFTTRSARVGPSDRDETQENRRNR